MHREYELLQELNLVPVTKRGRRHDDNLDHSFCSIPYKAHTFSTGPSVPASPRSTKASSRIQNIATAKPSALSS